MSVLDKAFLRAYTKDRMPESSRDVSNAATVATNQTPVTTSAAPQVRAATPAVVAPKLSVNPKSPSITVTAKSAAAYKPAGPKIHRPKGVSSTFGAPPTNLSAAKPTTVPQTNTPAIPAPPTYDTSARTNRIAEATKAESLSDVEQVPLQGRAWTRFDAATSLSAEAIPAPHLYFATSTLDVDAIDAAPAAGRHDDSTSGKVPTPHFLRVSQPATVVPVALNAVSPHKLNATPVRQERLLGRSDTSSFTSAQEKEIDSAADLETTVAVSMRGNAIIPTAPQLQTAVADDVDTDSSTDASTDQSANEPNEPQLSASHEAMLSATKAAKPKLSAVWEVEQFLWPEECDSAMSVGFDHFREAGTQLHKAARSGLNVITVTSSQRGEGRTLLSLCLARAVAATGIRVALLDADLENPQLATQLGVEVTSGWADVVRGELPLAEAAVYSDEDRITLFPLTDDLEKRNFSLSDPRVTVVINKLKQHFDLVVIDMGPVGLAHRRLFAGGEICPIDAALLIRDLRITSQEDAYTAAARLKANGIRSVGLIENFV